MDTPTLRFLGWDRPALELVADALLQWDAAEPDSFRRALVVVPTAESGRRLRACMAERAGRPLLVPRTTLMGLLVPEEGAASSVETLAAWMQVLGGTAGFREAEPRRVLEVALPLLRIRQQLEREGRLPDFSRDDFERFAASLPHREDWSTGIDEEVRRWESLRVLFAEVDRTLEEWGCQPAEKVREAAIAHPSPALRGRHLVVACVPELSPQIRRYLCQLVRAGARVEIWINAPASERIHLDAFGQPLAEYWASCPIDMDLSLGGEMEGSKEGGIPAAAVHIEPHARAMALKARSLAGGCSSREIALACCDPAFAPSLVTAFAPEWKLNLPEGRSLMTTSAALLPAQLAKACQEIRKLPLFDERTGSVLHGDALSVEAFLELARNPVIQQCYGAGLGGLGGFSRAVDEVLQRAHPASISRLLEVLEAAGPETPADGSRPLSRQYATYGKRIRDLVQGCAASRSFSGSLSELAERLSESFSHCGEHTQQATGRLASSLKEVVRMAGCGFRACSPAMALELWRHLVENQATGALEEMRHDDTVLDVVGWRELSFACARRILLVAMHDGCVPETAPQDACLPDAFRRFMKMTGARERAARDAFLLTALLHGQHGQGREVHFLLSKVKPDGAPAFPSSLLLRCKKTPEGRRVLAARADYFFRPSQRVTLPEPYDRLPLLDTPVMPSPEPGEMEPISLIAPGVTNRYAREEESFSPSRIAEFLRCPLRFWLRLLRGICPADAYREETGEMSPLEYGSVLHDVLRETVAAFPGRPSAGSVQDWERQIRQCALHSLAEAMLRHYGGAGESLPLPLAIQQKSMELSLSAFARCHAADLAEGWENRYLEHPVRLPLAAEGQPDIWLDMRLDRVDFHPATGRWRVVDYKTNEHSPAEVHVAGVPGGLGSRFCQWMPGFRLMAVSRKGGELVYRRWKNVQLPLYAWALMQQEALDKEDVPETGYYNLPKKQLSTVRYTPFLSVTEDKQPFSRQDLDSALDWVREAARLIRAGQCLYSAETLGIEERYDTFGALCPEMDPREMCGLPPV